MGTVATCSCCKEKIGGVEYAYNNKKYCYTCFQKLQAEKEEEEKQRIGFLSFLREAFGVAHIPQETIMAIEYERKSGKKYSGMKMTLEYCLYIKGQTVDISKAGFFIKNYYEETKQYYVQQKELRERNEAVNIVVPPVIVKLKEEDLYSKRDKKLTSIENL